MSVEPTLDNLRRFIKGWEQSIQGSEEGKADPDDLRQYISLQFYSAGEALEALKPYTWKLLRQPPKVSECLEVFGLASIIVNISNIGIDLVTGSGLRPFDSFTTAIGVGIGVVYWNRCEEMRDAAYARDGFNVVIADTFKPLLERMATGDNPLGSRQF